VIVDYAEAAAAFFVLRQEGTALPVAVAEGSPARRLRDACEPVAMHAVWSRVTNERLAQLGLDFLTSYVGGRGAFLGEVCGRLNHWGQLCIEAGAFPPDILKRAAG
jgi:hypothetical protein